jgi:hypothetical protein
MLFPNHIVLNLVNSFRIIENNIKEGIIREATYILKNYIDLFKTKKNKLRNSANKNGIHDKSLT